MMNCPKCDEDISDTFERDDPSVGINGGWYCGVCDLAVGEHEVERERFDDDVPIITAREARGDRPLGTPLAELSGQPGDPRDPNDPRHAGYEKFKQIARSWGYD